jgi:hypothetical protein
VVEIALVQHQVARQVRQAKPQRKAMMSLIKHLKEQAVRLNRQPLTLMILKTIFLFNSCLFLISHVKLADARKSYSAKFQIRL